MTTIPGLTRLSTILAFVLASLISVVLPAGYFAVGYQDQKAVLATEAYMNAMFLSQAISQSPEYWRYEQHRLAEVLSQHTSRKYDEKRSVVDTDNAVVARSGGNIDPPLLSVSHSLYDSGNVVGRIEIVSSLRPLLKNTVLSGIAGLILGFLIFATLRVFPLRALSGAMRSVYEEKEKGRAILNNIPDMAWLKDKDDRYITANDTFCKICGVPPKDLPGRTDLDLWPRDLAEHYKADDREVMATGMPKEIDEQIVDTEGRTTWISTIKTPIFTDKGEVIGTTGIARDFTERKRMEEELREREEKLRTLTQIAQDAIVVMDHEGKISFWNPAAEKIFGYGSKEALGKELHSLLGPQRYYEPYRRGFEIFRETGEGAAVGKTLELLALRKGDEEFPIELSLSSIQIRGRWHAVGIIRDIAGRKQAEEETLCRNALMERLNCALVSLAKEEKIYSCDLDTAFRAITEASALAMDIGRVSIWFYTDGNVGIKCMDLYEMNSGAHSEGIVLESVNYPAYFDAIQREQCMAADDAVADHRTREFSESYLIPIGITSMLDVPIRVAGKVIGVVCHEHVGAPRQWRLEEQSFVTAIAGFTSTVIEVCERRRIEGKIKKLNEELELKVRERTKQLTEAQEELVRKEKLAVLGQLAGSVGHELRNPLGVINNAIYFLKTVLTDADGTVKEYLGMIKSEVDNSERIISDLLDFSRTKPPQIKAVAVNELVDRSMARCAIPANVPVETDIPDTLPEVTVDPFQMGQVFQNLITNAVQAMPEGGVLRVNAKKAQKGRSHQAGEQEGLQTSAVPAVCASGLRNYVEISIEDTGEGIPPENMGKVFQPLFTTKAKGIGLGLVVSKKLTESNGGRIDVESEPGKGTIFTVTLPVGRDKIQS